MARHATDSVAPLRRSKLSSPQGSSHNLQGVVDGRVNKVGVSTAAPDGVQYSAVECTRDRVAVRRIVAPAPHPKPVSCLRNATSASCKVTQGVSNM